MNIIFTKREIQLEPRKKKQQGKKNMAASQESAVTMEACLCDRQGLWVLKACAPVHISAQQCPAGPEQGERAGLHANQQLWRRLLSRHSHQSTISFKTSLKVKFSSHLLAIYHSQTCPFRVINRYEFQMLILASHFMFLMYNNSQYTSNGWLFSMCFTL